MICIGVIKDCKNPDNYGMICVRCNDCGRFDIVRKCANCGKELKGTKLIYPQDWEQVEFYDSLREPICPDCVKYFPNEIITDGFSHKFISCKVIEFEIRKQSKDANGNKL